MEGYKYGDRIASKLELYSASNSGQNRGHALIVVYCPDMDNMRE